MKFKFIIPTVLCLTVLLAACGNSEPEESPLPTETPEVTVAPVETVEPTETPEMTEKPEETVVPSETPPTEELETPTPAPEATAQPVTSPEPTPEPTPEPVVTETPVTASYIWDQISASVSLGSLTDGGEGELSSLYGLDSGLVEDFVLKMPAMGVEAIEIFIAKVAPENIDTVKNAITARQENLLELWSEYLPEQAAVVENAQVVTSGDYIIFVVSENSENIVNIFNQFAS